MSRFTWEDEERRYKRSVHSRVTSALHATLACDIHPNGRGDRAAHFIADSSWNDYRYKLEQHRSEVLALKAEIRKLKKQLEVPKNAKDRRSAK